MATDEYIKARKLGLKELNACLQRNVSPYLPALEDQVSHLNALTRVPLGVISIPLKNIVGTATSGRGKRVCGQLYARAQPL